MKAVAAFLLGCLATNVSATETTDTLVIEDANKVRIETRDTVQRIVISGMKEDPEFHYVQRISIPDSSAVRRTIKSVRDFNKIVIKNKDGKPSKWTSSGHFNIGLGTMLDAPDGFDFKLWPSFDLGIGSTWDYHPFGKQNEWSIGWGINWNMYRLSNDTYLTKDAQNMVVTMPYPAGVDERNTMLNRFSLQLPLMYTHYFDKKQDWSLSLGAIVNWNVYGTASRHYCQGDEEHDITMKHIGQMPFTFDGIVKVGMPWLPDLYVKYSPSKFFRDSRGPKMQQLSFGICF